MSSTNTLNDNQTSFRPTFKKIRKKEFRKKIEDDDDDDDHEEEDIDALQLRLEESKEIRKIRKKHGGVTAEVLLAGRSNDAKEDKDDDPFKAKCGGMLDLNALKNSPKLDDAYDTGIGTSFSAETNRRDEDAEMQRFIEENLAKKKGVKKENETVEEKKYLSPEEAALQSVPDFLRKSSSKKSEEMLSNQMLSGIPEVDLGLEAKIRNIEATEDAKQQLLRDSLMKKERPSEFVPKNMAVNFVQHSRFNIEDHSLQREKKKHKVKVQEIIEPVVGGGVKISTVAPKRLQTEKATDDFHYEKFRKQFRRH